MLKKIRKLLERASVRNKIFLNKIKNSGDVEP